MFALEHDGSTNFNIRELAFKAMVHQRYEMLAGHLPGDMVNVAIDQSMPDSGRVHSWYLCSKKTSCVISRAEANASVKLWLPTDSGSGNSTRSATFQLICKTWFAAKLFISTQNYILRLFRPLPIFEVNIKSTMGNLPGNIFEVQATSNDKTTGIEYDICIRIPEASTIKQAQSIIREAVIDAASIYDTSNSQDKYTCIVTQFKNKKTCLLALPVLLHKKAEVMKKPSSIESPRRDAATKKHVLKRPAAAKK